MINVVPTKVDGKNGFIVSVSFNPQMSPKTFVTSDVNEIVSILEKLVDALDKQS